MIVPVLIIFPIFVYIPTAPVFVPVRLIIPVFVAVLALVFPFRKIPTPSFPTSICPPDDRFIFSTNTAVPLSKAEASIAIPILCDSEPVPL